MGTGSTHDWRDGRSANCGGGATVGDGRAVVVLTGAGVSQESGIPTFRDAQTGLWARYDPTATRHARGICARPAIWYGNGMPTATTCSPPRNPIRVTTPSQSWKTLFPEVTVITQNIDGLHQAAGSTDVVELHGSIRRYKCLNGGHTGFTHADFADQAEIPPRCPCCGDLLRPDVVWFGEMLPADALNRAIALSEAVRRDDRRGHIRRSAAGGLAAVRRRRERRDGHRR